MSTKEDLKHKLRATIEAKKIARLSLELAWERLDELKEKRKRARGAEKKRLNVLIDILEKELEKIEENNSNMQYGEPIDGGIGFGSCGGAGHDNG